MSAIKPEMSADLTAWLHTCAAHGGLVSVGDSWFDSNNVGMLRETVEAFEPDDDRLEHEGIEGLELDQAIVMANTADGEVFYAAAWRPGDASTAVVKVLLRRVQGRWLSRARLVRRRAQAHRRQRRGHRRTAARRARRRPRGRGRRRRRRRSLSCDQASRSVVSSIVARKSSRAMRRRAHSSHHDDTKCATST